MSGLLFNFRARDRTKAARTSIVSGLNKVNNAQNRVNKSSASFAKGLSANRRIIQNVGFQVSDLGVQIAGGQSAILSLTQNVPQVVQMFGAWGAILAAVITLLGTFTLIMQRSGQGLSDIASFFGVAQAEVEAFSDAMGAVGNALIGAVNLMLNNLDSLFSTLAVIAAFMVGKWVISFVAASSAARVLGLTLAIAGRRGIAAGAQFAIMTGVIGTLRNAFILLTRVIVRTGIGALIVAAGYLVERLFTLTKATGSWGATFKLVGDLIKQVFGNIGLVFAALVLKLVSATANIGASFKEMLADMVLSTGASVDNVIGFFRGLLNATVAIFKNIGILLADAIAKRVNAVIKGAFAAVNGVIALLNILKPGSFDIPTIGPDNFLLPTTGATLSSAIDDIKSSFEDGFNTVTVGPGGDLTKKLMEGAQEARRTADSLRAVSDRVSSAASNAIPAWQKIKDLLGETDAAAKQLDIRDLFNGSKDSDVTGGAADAAKAVSDKFKRTQDAAKNAVGELGLAFDSSNIDFSVDRIKQSISGLSDISAPDMTHILRKVDEIRGRIGTLSAPIQAEKAKLDAILSSDLATVNPDKFFADTREIVTRIQELSAPIRQEIANINALDPRLSNIDTSFFDQSLTNTTTGVRRTTDSVRELVAEVNGVSVLSLPEIDTKPATKSIDSFKFAIKDAQNFIADLGQVTRDSLTTNLKGLITGATSFRDAIGNVLDSIADQLLDFGLNTLFDSLGSAFGGGGGAGGFFGNIVGSLFSFNGGGFTGSGTRSGGVDGKGGFPAILHPNETVIDHEKLRGADGDMSRIGSSYNGGGGAITVVMSPTNNFNGVTREEVMRDVEMSQQQMMDQADRELPSKIDKHTFNRNRGLA